MLPELDRLVRLQRLDDAEAAARRAIDDFPHLSGALDARVDEKASALAALEKRLAAHKVARATLDKDLAEVQSRLSRFKTQLMEVKTNKEYHAMQAEIATAEAAIRQQEDAILDRMLEGDELAAEVAEARTALEAERQTVAAERAVLEQERHALEAKATEQRSARSVLVAELSREALDLFNTLARGRKGIAVGQARDGLCSVCRVRLRPQLYNEVRRNASLLQCESCQRILYYQVEATTATESS